MSGDLGEAAQAGLASVADEQGMVDGGQPALEGTNYTQVSFLGVKADTLDHGLKIGDLVRCTVVGRVKEVGDKQMKDDSVRHVVKVDVDSVILNDGDESAE